MRVIIFSFLRTWIAIVLIAGLTGISKTHAAPPSDFSLVQPEHGASVSTSILLDWEGSRSSNELMYRICVSKNNDTFEDPIRIEGIEESIYILEEKDGIEDANTYYWKVWAIDNFGEYTESEVRQFHTSNNTNPLPAWIGGYIFNVENGPVANATVMVSIWNNPFVFHTDSAGFFLGQLSPDGQINPGTKESVAIEIVCDGYAPINNTMMIKTGNRTDTEFTMQMAAILGDIDGDRDVDLTDAVRVFQILAGTQTSSDIDKEAALGKDKKIDLSELIFILTQISVLEAGL